MKATKPLFFLCMALSFAACKKEVDMTLIEKTMFENADIRHIEAGDAWQVTVVADSSTYVELAYSAYLEDFVSVIMENDSLKIGFRQKVYPQMGSIFKATVHTQHISGIEAHDATQMVFEGDLNDDGDITRIDLDGASVCYGLHLGGKDIYVNVSDASQFLDFNINSANCLVKVEGASSCKGVFDLRFHLEAVIDDASQMVALGGTSYYGALVLSSGSLANVAQMPVNELSVRLSGASEATVYATDSIVGSLTDSSTLYYKGHPQLQVDCDESSATVPF